MRPPHCAPVPASSCVAPVCRNTSPRTRPDSSPAASGATDRRYSGLSAGVRHRHARQPHRCKGKLPGRHHSHRPSHPSSPATPAESPRAVRSSGRRCRGAHAPCRAPRSPRSDIGRGRFGTTHSSGSVVRLVQGRGPAIPRPAAPTTHAPARSGLSACRTSPLPPGRQLSGPRRAPCQPVPAIPPSVPAHVPAPARRLSSGVSAPGDSLAPRRNAISVLAARHHPASPWDQASRKDRSPRSIARWDGGAGRRPQFVPARR